MASYDDYLKELGHTRDNVATEKFVLKNDIESLSNKLEKQKLENDILSANIKEQNDKNIRLKEQLAIKER